MFPPRSKTTFYKRYKSRYSGIILWGKFVWKYNSWHMNIFPVSKYSEIKEWSARDCIVPVIITTDGYRTINSGLYFEWIQSA